MESNKEYVCGSKELSELLGTNDFLLCLNFLIFIVPLLVGVNISFIVCSVGFAVSSSTFAIIESLANEDDKSILKSYIKATKISMHILFFFLIIATFLLCLEFPWKDFSMRYIPGYVFFIVNVALFINYKHINSVSKDMLEKIESKEKVKEEIRNTSTRITKTLSIIEHMFDGLEYDEKDILKPCVLKLQELFMLSYDTLYNIKNPDVFCDIESFILRYEKTINAYKKGKGSSDLDFLERLNNSAEELYFTLNSKEQALKKDNFENKIEILKIKLNQVY